MPLFKKFSREEGFVPLLGLLVTALLIGGIFLGVKVIQDPTNLLSFASLNKDNTADFAQTLPLILYHNQSNNNYVAYPFYRNKTKIQSVGYNWQTFENLSKAADQKQFLQNLIYGKGVSTQQTNEVLGYILKEPPKNNVTPILKLSICRKINNPSEIRNVVADTGIDEGKCDPDEKRTNLGYAYKTQQPTTHPVFFCQINPNTGSYFLGNESCNNTGREKIDIGSIWLLDSPVVEKINKRAAEVLNSDNSEAGELNPNQQSEGTTAINGNSSISWKNKANQIGLKVNEVTAAIRRKLQKGISVSNKEIQEAKDKKNKYDEILDKPESQRTDEDKDLIIEHRKEVYGESWANGIDQSTLDRAAELEENPSEKNDQKSDNDNEPLSGPGGGEGGFIESDNTYDYSDDSSGTSYEPNKEDDR